MTRRSLHAAAAVLVVLVIAVAVALRPRGPMRLADPALSPHAGEALLALRTRVSAAEVPDHQVTLAFWRRVVRTSDPASHAGAEWVGGFWLGEDRAVALVWDASTRAIPEMLRGEPTFLAYRAGNAYEREGLAALRRTRPRSVPTSFDGFHFTFRSGWNGAFDTWSTSHAELKSRDEATEVEVVGLSAKR